MSLRSKHLRLVAAGAVVLLAACDSTSPIGPPVDLNLVGTYPASATAGSLVPSVTVKAVDFRGRGISGAKVTFSVTDGDGSITSHFEETGSDGTAHVDWTLGLTVGSNTLFAKVDGPDSSTTLTVTGTAGSATAIGITPKILRLPAGTTTALLAGGLVDQFGNSVSGTATYTSRNTGLVTVSSSGGVTVTGAGGTTYIVVSGGGFTDSALVVVLKAGDSPCTGMPVSANLAVGDVMTTGFDANNGVCVQSTVAGGEYALVPFYDSPVATEQTVVSLTGFGIKTPTVLGFRQPTGLSLSVGASSQMMGMTPGAAAFHERIRAEERREMTARAAGARAWYRARAAQPLRAAKVPAMNDELKLNVNAGDYCANAVIHTGRVVAVTERAIVVADLANPEGGFTDDEYRAIGVTFDTLVYPLDLANFGEPTDIDNNGGRAIIFFTHAVNELGSGILGFFYPRDLLPKLGPLGSCPGSNVAEMFYILVPDGGTTKATVTTNAVGTTAHEFQHLINAARRMYVNTDAAPSEEVWLNEGLSSVAEELMFYHASGLSPRSNLGAQVFSAPYSTAYQNYQANNSGRFRSYLSQTDQQGPIGSFDGDDDLQTRGATWSFLRYATDLRLQTTEAAIWKKLVNSNLAGMDNLRDVFGSDVNLMMRDWGLAVLLDDLVPTAAKYQLPSWNARAVTPGYPLFTPPLPTNGTAYSATLRTQGMVAARFGTNAGQEAYVTAAGSLGQALPRHVLLALVRTK